MSLPWHTVPLAELLSKSEDWVTLEPMTQYHEITVRLWGKGVVERRVANGAEIAAGRRIAVRSDQFILSRIDARHGASGLVPPELDGAVVSTDFPVFSMRTTRILPKFLGWMSKTAGFVELCKAASEGTTNRVRLKEDRFLAMTIPLPPLAEQRRIVARIDALAARVEEARGLRRAAAAEVEALVGAASAELFSDLAGRYPSIPIGETFTYRNDLIRPTDGEVGWIRFIGLQHIESDSGRRVGEDSLLAEELSGRKFRFSPGEIVYGYLRPYLNKVWIADCEGVCSVDQYVLRLNEDINDVHYLAYFMRSPVFLRQAIALTHNLLLPRLRTGLLNSIPIPLPPLAEQRRIVAYLDDLQAKVDGVKRLQAETQAELDALLPAILDRAFKGEL